MTEEEWRGGLAPHYDYMLPGKPENPEMRESASIWLYEENGEFAFLRNGIEAVGAQWDAQRYDNNFAFKDGRALFDACMNTPPHSPIGPEGKPTILGVGGFRMECVEPFRRWRVTYEGTPVDTTSAANATNTMDTSKTTSLRYEVDLTMVTPCWVQDHTPEKIAQMSERERADAESMGIGYRMEHLFRGSGKIWIDGGERDFNCVGLRVHRQSIRPLGGFRGHVWQSAVFPDGRAFGYIAYPPGEDGSTYNEGYIWQDGKWHDAVATRIPWFDEPVLEGEDLSFELESELGVTRINAVGGLNTYKVGLPEMPGFALNQGAARYEWDGQVAYGMIERSTLKNC